MKHRRPILSLQFLYLLSLGLVTCATSAQAEVYFRGDFSNWNQGKLNFSSIPDYGDEYRLRHRAWGLEPPPYRSKHVPGQGFDGSDGVHFTVRRGQRQFHMGWMLDAGGKRAGWQQGDRVFVRFRVRFDDDFRWDESSRKPFDRQQNKFLDIGNGPIGRFILMQEGGTGLYKGPYLDNGQGKFREYVYDLPGGAFDDGDYGTLSLRQGAGGDFARPIPVTHGVWYHVQLELKTGSTAQSADGYYKIWVNSNKYDGETDPKRYSELLNIRQSVQSWNAGWLFGGYYTHQNSNRDQGWIISAFEVGDTFDPKWYPGKE